MSGWTNNEHLSITDEEYEEMIAVPVTPPRRPSVTQPKPTRTTIGQIQEMLKRTNPWRWRRMHNDLKWTQKQLNKWGMGSYDARWFL